MFVHTFLHSAGADSIMREACLRPATISSLQCRVLALQSEGISVDSPASALPFCVSLFLLFLIFIPSSLSFIGIG